MGQSLPVSLSPLRQLLSALEAVAPAAVGAVAAQHPSAWNRLFPGRFPKAPALDDIALSPSERRLHRESEQMFQTLNVAALAIRDAVRASGRPLQLERVGASDLVSLRAVMRAQEWARLTGEELPLSMTGWSAKAAHLPERFEPRRQRFLHALRTRLRMPEPGAERVERVETKLPSKDEREALFLDLVVDPQQSGAMRVAAAVRAARACFFTTNYEGTMLATEQALALLAAPGSNVRQADVLAAWDSFGPELSTAAIEIEREELGSPSELTALLLRAEGVAHSYCGENDAALEAFAQGLAQDIGPLQRGHLHMFRALSLIKRMGQLEAARAEGHMGVAALGDEDSDRRRLHEAWLRNVVALTWFQGKNLEAALGEELEAIRCVQNQHSASATHLRINLITNLSSIQEAAKKYEQAINTWRKFETMKSAWDPNFYKHHRYRLAALLRGQGDHEAARTAYAEAYESAVKLDDPFHQQIVASDLGHMALQAGDRDASAEWFQKAEAHSRTMGDAFHTGEAIAGQWLTQKADKAEALKALAADSTWPKETAALVHGLESDDLTATRKAMTPPRSKLNRPFDLVNLY